MGKSTISMAIFNSFLYVYQAGYIPGIPVVDVDHITGESPGPRRPRYCLSCCYQGFYSTGWQ